MQAPHPLADTLLQLKRAIDDPYESIRMTLDQHPVTTLGDPQTEGTAAWHLVHASEVFRSHARHLTQGHADAWPEMPGDVPGSMRMLREDTERLTLWASDHLDPNATIEYGRSRSASDMLGVMLRHIVWHAAAAHYWCRWKRANNSNTDPDT
ncbi:MAG: hypothetical protein AAGA55_00285 [Planctomycetota bacterium]